MSAFVWGDRARAFWRDQARMHPGGIARTFAGLSDLLDAAEARAAWADVFAARLDAASALHQPEAADDGRLVCSHCPNRTWPCPTAEALTDPSRRPVLAAPTPTHQTDPANGSTAISGPPPGKTGDTTP